MTKRMDSEAISIPARPFAGDAPTANNEPAVNDALQSNGVAAPDTAIYLEHFGLRESPFRITPQKEFFFSGAKRGSTLEALIYAVTHDEGIVKVSGEVGSGKTMLCRMLLERLPRHIDTVYLGNSSLSSKDILYAIAEELQEPLPDERPHQLLRSLQDILADIQAAGRQVLIMLDEAHAMPPETLEEIRLLSNLEANGHKLVHIVLFGQPELDRRLIDLSMRPLKERITHNFALEPLRHSDVETYLAYRMRAAGYRGPDLFTAGAIHLISLASEGLTRRINVLADKALLSAFSENKHLIDSKQVRAAIRDAQFRPMHHGRRLSTVWILGGICIAVLIAGAFIAGSRSGTDPIAAETRPAPPPAVAQLPATPQGTAAPAPAANAEPPATPAIPGTATAPAQAAPENAPTPTPAPTTLEARIESTEEWLAVTPDSHYFIQLFSTDATKREDLEQFLQRLSPLDPEQVRVYHSNLSGRDRLGVIYGDYPNREAAHAGLSQIVRQRIVSGPYVRSVSKLRK